MIKIVWYFLIIDGEVVELICVVLFGWMVVWGLVYVCVMVGDIEWCILVFFSKNVSGYLFLIKVSVCKVEKLIEGDVIVVMFVL